MGSFFELKQKEENMRGEKVFISKGSGVFFSSNIQVETYISVKNVINGFTLKMFKSNFDLTELTNFKKYYLGDDNFYSYYLLDTIFLETKPEIKTIGKVIFINGTSYLPLSLAYDLCTDQRSKKLIEAISNTNI